jgi:hypothetical protein
VKTRGSVLLALKNANHVFTSGGLKMTVENARPLQRILGLGFGVAIAFGTLVGSWRALFGEGIGFAVGWCDWLNNAVCPKWDAAIQANCGNSAASGHFHFVNPI